MILMAGFIVLGLYILFRVLQAVGERVREHEHTDQISSDDTYHAVKHIEDVLKHRQY